MNAAANAVAERLDRHRVYILPSRAGLMLGVIMAIILLGAINYDNALAYLLSFLLAGLLMIAMLHTYRNLAGLGFLGARAEPVFAGETAQFECLFDNDTRQPRLEIVVKHWPRGCSRQQRRYLRRFENRFHLAPRSAAGAVVVADAERRGRLPLGRIMVHTCYPLGVLHAWAYFETGASALVYPHPHGEKPLPPASASATGAHAQSPAGAEEFAGLRRYSAGDPVRAIAWKTLAKGHALMVKKFAGQASAQLWLRLDALNDIAGLEARLSQLTAWVLAAERGGAAYGLDLGNTRIELGRGAAHRDACLTALALFGDSE